MAADLLRSFVWCAPARRANDEPGRLEPDLSPVPINPSSKSHSETGSDVPVLRGSSLESVYERNGGLHRGGPMKSPVVKRSIMIDGHKTSISVEDAFWIDPERNRSSPVSKLVTQIDETRQQGNLSSAIRLYVLEHIRTHGQNGLERNVQK
jgi:predicted DNA-binding ribbon-helix-helix protein